MSSRDPSIRSAAPPGAVALRQAAIRTLAIDDQTAAVVSGLEARGVDVLLLKGPAVARRLYDAGEARFYGDTDLLVAPHARAAAERALRELGYERLVGDRTAALIGHHGSHWRRPDSLLEVDLHHTLIGVRGASEELWAALRDHAVGLDMQGVCVRAPDDAALALHVALHAAQHGVARAKPRRDLERALRRLGEEAWRTAVALATRVDAIDAFGVGLRLLPEGAALAARLGVPAGRSRNAELRAMAAPSVTLGLDRLSETAGMRRRARLLLAWTFPPADFMRGWSALARSGRGGLVLAYLWRPLALASQSVPAVRAWRRASRVTREPRA
jgi:hypothetical protein